MLTPYGSVYYNYREVSRPWNPLIARTFYRCGHHRGVGTLKMAGLTTSSGLPQREEKGASVMRRKIPVLVSLTFLMVSCGLNPFNSDKPDPADRIYQIHVDSVSVGSPLRVFDLRGTFRTLLVKTTSPLAVSDTMHVRFYGWEGSGCEVFSHIDTTRIDLVGYKVSLWGRQIPSDVCPGEVRYLNPEWNRDHILEFYPPLRVGTWIFLVSQPDGSVLRKEAVVR